MDRQSIIMLRLFCVLEAILVVLTFKCLPFPAFVVLHQLLLAYPGNKFFELVAAIICLWKKSEQPLLPIELYGHQREVKFLEELLGDLNQMQPELKKVGNNLRQYERNLTWTQLPAQFQNTIRNIKSQTKDLRCRVEHVDFELRIVIVYIHMKLLRNYQLQQQQQLMIL
jgi:hypothetical protein